jgi:hypothetical protein
MSYRLCWFLDSGILIPLARNQHNLFLLLCVQCETPNDGQKTCPKHVEFYSKNKFEKLVHLVGFIIRIYHDARFSECQIRGFELVTVKVYCPFYLSITALYDCVSCTREAWDMTDFIRMQSLSCVLTSRNCRMWDVSMLCLRNETNICSYLAYIWYVRITT